ncbi:MAG: 2-amino-4-hydroxy-6-hydroxymethyldihydropteridine diphosphokinase [Kofleriaceae bacterium]
MSLSTDPVVIGLGGNLGTDDQLRERFRRAREALEGMGAVRSAPLYRTAPIGPDQPPFLNTAVEVRIPDLQPRELISLVLELEGLLGRDRRGAVHWGPRAIDLDVLVWGGRVIRTPELTVPHAELAVRRFALAPLVALLGEDFEIPGAGRACDRLREVADQGLEQIAERW